MNAITFITLGDGTKKPVKPHVTSAFAALGRGEATAGQQKLCLHYLFTLGNPMGFPVTSSTDREAWFAIGARWLTGQVAKLVGGEQPFTLNNLGDMDDGSDASER